MYKCAGPDDMATIINFLTSDVNYQSKLITYLLICNFHCPEMCNMHLYGITLIFQNFNPFTHPV